MLRLSMDNHGDSITTRSLARTLYNVPVRVIVPDKIIVLPMREDAAECDSRLAKNCEECGKLYAPWFGVCLHCGKDYRPKTWWERLLGR
jgi:hypothetical protein